MYCNPTQQVYILLLYTEYYFLVIQKDLQSNDNRYSLFFSVIEPGVVAFESGLFRLGDLDPLDKDLVTGVDDDVLDFELFLGDLLSPLLDSS